MAMNKFMIGYDYVLLQNMGIKTPIYASTDSHLMQNYTWQISRVVMNLMA